MMIKHFLFSTLLLFTFSVIQGQNHPILGKWYTENDASIVHLKELDNGIAGASCGLKIRPTKMGSLKKTEGIPKRNSAPGNFWD